MPPSPLWRAVLMGSLSTVPLACQLEITWVGGAGEAPEAAETIDCSGQLITPALIDAIPCAWWGSRQGI